MAASLNPGPASAPLLRYTWLNDGAGQVSATRVQGAMIDDCMRSDQASLKALLQAATTNEAWGALASQLDVRITNGPTSGRLALKAEWGTVANARCLVVSGNAVGPFGAATVEVQLKPR